MAQLEGICPVHTEHSCILPIPNYSWKVDIYQHITAYKIAEEIKISERWDIAKKKKKKLEKNKNNLP